MRSVPFLSPFHALAVLALGCGGSTEPSSGDAGGDTGTDTSVTDTSVTDTGSGDTAVTDAGADTPTDATGVLCDKVTCAPSETCVRTHFSGGPCMTCTGGCSAGYHCSGSCCTPDTITYTYECKPTPSACSGGLACGGACGSALCPTACGCESVSDSIVTCHICAP